MIRGEEMCRMVELVARKLGDDGGREWWKATNPDLAGKTPSDLMLSGLHGRLDAGSETALKLAVLKISS